MSEWVIGQRCASTGEPTLGLGIVKDVNQRNIMVFFPATATERTYAVRKAPLRRVIFEPGELVRDNEGNSFYVVEAKEQNGIMFYLGETELLPETELNDSIVFSKPHQRLLAGHVDKPWAFDLRSTAWELKNKNLSSPCRGLIGARIELIPHQLYIAQEVAKRRHPRVLLSDEVGLGKTIEAGLIFHQLWITGEVKRVLVLVPPQLTTQWLTELYRKFNVLFSIMTPIQAEELSKSNANPYMAHQCVLQDLNSLVKNPDLGHHILDAEWDLVIVDEAHHLFWSEQEVSMQYQLVEALSDVCGGMLLLTATPRQLGLASHFGRLRLLDPERFGSLEKFNEEVNFYGKLAEITERVLEGSLDGIHQEISELFPEDRQLIEEIPANADAPLAAKQAFCRSLIDRHGTGRMVFRNHRKVLSGYPARNVHPVELPQLEVMNDFYELTLGQMQSLEDGQRILGGAPAFQANDLPGKPQAMRSLLMQAWQHDPRLNWLLPFLRKHPDDKFLFICSQKTVVLALQEWFGLVKDIDIAVFHEDLNLIERDRQAAYFSKPNGAQILICSEIGSEGRNFQFAHKLILFDLPLNPALLEQRIGRLDRIGQQNDIQIYVPFVTNSPMHRLFHWYHEGLDAFENHLLEGDYIFEHLQDDLITIFKNGATGERMAAFIEESRLFAKNLRDTIEKGRDRLLELNSFNEAIAEEFINEVEEVEADPTLKVFMDSVFEMFGVSVEDQEALHTQIVKPSPQMFVESFPCLPEEGLEITYDREQAVMREEFTFLSYDHPMVNGCIDMVLNMDRGASSFAIWKNAPEAGILLHCLYVFECEGGDELRLGRYLPPIPIPITVDQNRKIRDDLLDELSTVHLDHGPVGKLHKQRAALTDIVESLVVIAEQEANNLAEAVRKEAEAQAIGEHKAEYDRLKALMDINPSVRGEELEYIEERLNMIYDHLEMSAVRLDAVQLIMMVPQ